RRAARALGLGEIDAVAPDRGARFPEQRCRQLSRSRGAGAGVRDRHGVSELCALPLAHGARERAARTRSPGGRRGADAQARTPGDRPDRARRLRVRLSARALGRYGSAGGLRGGVARGVRSARARVSPPNITFRGEPFSALDVLTAETLRGDFLNLWGE